MSSGKRKRFYAGIGSRRTPGFIQEFMTETAQFLSANGYILRSGAAEGADRAFEKGVQDESLKEIYLPWLGFNGHQSEHYKMSVAGFFIGERYHPRWHSLTGPAKRLMVRNGYQVLGFDLQEPVDFVLCWTPEGKKTGGTAQAIRIAEDHDIPVINFYFSSNRDQVKKWIDSGKVLLGPKTRIESWNLI